MSAPCIDLRRHGVIEASAGTGKTYQIETLVVELLKSGEVEIDQILVVTFTEKATGEMKARIRARLAALADADPAMRRALDGFDQAAIMTIHAFCLRVLRQFAFENRQAFALEQVNDADLFPSLLREQQRRVWPGVFGARLRDFLALSGYPDAQDDQSRWEQRVLSLAQRYHPQAGHRLRPPLDADPAATLDRLNARVQQTLRGLAELTGSPEEFLTRYQGLNLNTRSLEVRARNILTPLCALIARSANETLDVFDYAALDDSLRDCSGYDNAPSYELLVAGKPKKTGEDPAAWPALLELIARLNALRAEIASAHLSHQLALFAVRRLREDIAARKARDGQLSYDDMPALVHAALYGPNGDMLRDALRAQFRYALVDEFQDTDTIQWQIFRALFVGDGPQRLFLIGDPKQAIYAFRSADPAVYHTAVQVLVGEQGAHRYTLDINWRGVPELVAEQNLLFSRFDWFSRSGIAFQPVQAAPVDKAPLRVDADTTGRPPVTLIDVGALTPVVKARARLAAAIADECVHLLSGRLLLRARDGVPRPLDAGDIAVLVRSTFEAKAIEEALDARGVPHAHYKKTGVFQSDEATQIYYLLPALADPARADHTRKALLTDFFGLTGDDLIRDDGAPVNDHAHELLLQWHDLAARRDWPRLFARLLDDTRVLDPAGDGPDPRWERRMSNYRHLLHTLETTAIEQHLDIEGLIAWLRRRRADTMSDADDDLHPLETEERRVQLMTIHAAKGLQFPVVFVAGGLGISKARTAPPYLVYHDDGAVCFDLEVNGPHKDRHTNEQDAEDERLYYVALTRAMVKLYLPVVEINDTKARLGPLVTLVGAAVRAAWPDPEPARRLSPSPLAPPPQLPACAPADAAPPPPPDYYPPPRIDVRRRVLALESYSALRALPARGEHEPAPLHYPDAPPPRASDEPLVLPPTMVAGTTDALPPGARVGSLLHMVLETIDYAAVAAATNAGALLAQGSPTAAVIDAALRRFPLDTPQDLARKAVAALAWNALHTPLPLSAQALRLCDLAPEQRLHELEFFYPAAQLPAGASEPTCEREGFLRGFIDLVFAWRSADGGPTRYGVLDWKSNALDTYDSAGIAAAMDHADYHLQYKVYCVALRRWLESKLTGGDAAARVGPVVYLFLRGCNGRDAQTGVFLRHIHGREELDLFEHELRVLVDRPRISWETRYDD